MTTIIEDGEAFKSHGHFLHSLFSIPNFKKSFAVCHRRWQGSRPMIRLALVGSGAAFLIGDLPVATLP